MPHSNMKVALLTRIRRVSRFIKEYVDYYLNLGVDKIFLLDNNHFDDPIDDKDTKIILDSYIQNGTVEVFEYFNSSFDSWIRESGNNKEFIKDSISEINKKFDYVMLFDADEWLDLKGIYPNIKDWIGFCRNKCGYFDDICVTFDSLINTKKIIVEECNSIIKTYYKCERVPCSIGKRISVAQKENFHNFHYSFSKDRIMIDTSGNILNEESFGVNLCKNRAKDTFPTLFHANNTSLDYYIKNHCLWTNRFGYITYLFLSTTLNKFGFYVKDKNILNIVFDLCKKYNVNFDYINDIMYIPEKDYE